MGGGAKSGARQGVLRAMGIDHARKDRDTAGPEGALCPLCRLRELEFFLGDFGQTLEQCPNRACPNHLPHRPQASA